MKESVIITNNVAVLFSNNLWPFHCQYLRTFLHSPLSLFPYPRLQNSTLKYTVAQKSVNLKQSVILTGILKFKPASQFLERYHSVLSRALNMEDLNSNNFCKFSK
jgi:hypothetical protein